MANNRIHTTFDLLSANVFNQASLQSIDLPFELIGYSEGTIDSSTGIVTSKNKYQNLEAGQRIIIKGFDNTATYKVETEVVSVVDNEDGTIIFTVLDNFIFEVTDITFYVTNDVKVKHGTIIDGNIQLTTIKDGEDKYPLIFQHEITRETFFNDKRNKLERESEVDLFFLCVADFKEWQIAEHNKFAIKPMRELALKFIEELKTSNGIGEFDTFEILDHVKFGVYTTEKGHTERIFNDNLSGVQLRMTIPFLKTCCCPSEIVNIPTTPCIPRTITRSLKNSLANLVDVDLDNPTNTQVLVYVDGVWVNQNQSGGGGTPEWDDILNKPATFPPSAHTHHISEVNGLQDALDLKLDAVDYVQHFKGLFVTLLALQTAYPTANEGDYAQVDAGTGSNLQTYSYDLDEGWVLSSADGSGASNTDQLPEGATNLYFTSARAQAAAPAETASTIGAIVNGATNYATPLNADKIGIWDSLNGLFKSLTWANLKATLASTFFLDSTSSIQTQLNSKLPIEATATTGVALTFVTDSVYGSIATPETGNITYSATGAKLGVTNIIIHNNSSAPTFGANMKKLSGSGNYIINVVNYIYVTYINSTEVIYSINQRA